jgi:hypothetical protein
MLNLIDRKQNKIKIEKKTHLDKSSNTWRAVDVTMSPLSYCRSCVSGEGEGERWRGVESQVLLCKSRDRVYLGVRATEE